MPNYLVVANRTALGPALLEAIPPEAAVGGSRFHVVVPATPPKVGNTWTEGQAQALAAERLASAMSRMRREGLRVDGEVGDASPMLAVADALRRSSYDAIILSASPPRLSRRLGVDLASRIRAAFAVPVLHPGIGAWSDAA